MPAHAVARRGRARRARSRSSPWRVHTDRLDTASPSASTLGRTRSRSPVRGSSFSSPLEVRPPTRSELTSVIIQTPPAPSAIEPASPWSGPPASRRPVPASSFSSAERARRGVDGALTAHSAVPSAASDIGAHRRVAGMSRVHPRRVPPATRVPSAVGHHDVLARRDRVARLAADVEGADDLRRLGRARRRDRAQRHDEQEQPGERRRRAEHGQRRPRARAAAGAPRGAAGLRCCWRSAASTRSWRRAVM